MSAIMKRLIAVIMALALMIPAVAISEGEAQPVKITMGKTTFGYDEAIVFDWEVDPELVDMTDPMLNRLTFQFEFRDRPVEYANGYREKATSFTANTYDLGQTEGTSGTVSIDIPDCVSGTGYLSVGYTDKAAGATKYYKVEGLTVTNPEKGTDLIKVTYDKSLEGVKAGDEIKITNTVAASYGDYSAGSPESIGISASGNNPPPYFYESGKGTYTYTFAKACKYMIRSSISYVPADRSNISFSVTVTDVIDVPENAAPTPKPTSKPTAAPTTSAPTAAPTSAAPTFAPTNVPGAPVVLNLDAITIGAKQSVDTVKVVSGTVAAWTSSNEKIAKVDADGKITGVKKGTATITATSAEGESDSVEVTVVNKGKGVSKIKLSKKKAAIRQGDKLALKAIITPADAKNKKVVWNSSNTSVATVNAKGKVKAVGIGETVITATSSSGKTATCKITVAGAKVKKITIEGKSKMKVGETQTLIANILPEFAENKDLKWKSSSRKIATVDENGVVTALKKGTVKITVTAKDGSKVKATFAIKIKK